VGAGERSMTRQDLHNLLNAGALLFLALAMFTST
jgi:hypothetical protein